MSPLRPDPSAERDDEAADARFVEVEPVVRWPTTPGSREASGEAAIAQGADPRPSSPTSRCPARWRALDGVLAGVDGGGTTAAEAIERLMAAQIELRNVRRVEAAMCSSRPPYVKTLSAFDFAFQPSIKREQIDALRSWTPRFSTGRSTAATS